MNSLALVEPEEDRAIVCPVCEGARPIVNERARCYGTTKPNLRVLECGATVLRSLSGRAWFNFEEHRTLVVIEGGA